MEDINNNEEQEGSFNVLNSIEQISWMSESEIRNLRSGNSELEHSIKHRILQSSKREFFDDVLKPFHNAQKDYNNAIQNISQLSDEGLKNLIERSELDLLLDEVNTERHRILSELALLYKVNYYFPAIAEFVQNVENSDLAKNPETQELINDIAKLYIVKLGFYSVNGIIELLSDEELQNEINGLKSKRKEAEHLLAELVEDEAQSTYKGMELFYWILIVFFGSLSIMEGWWIGLVIIVISIISKLSNEKAFKAVFRGVYGGGGLVYWMLSASYLFRGDWLMALGTLIISFILFSLKGWWKFGLWMLIILYILL
jgi:hypothetical protein